MKNPSLKLSSLIVICYCLSSCIGDEGEWLGTKIGKAATELQKSQESELILSYSPDSVVNQNYSIVIGKSSWCPNPQCYENKYLTVEMERGRHGSTTAHLLFVSVPSTLEIHKNGQPTQIVLHKIDGVIFGG